MTFWELMTKVCIVLYGYSMCQVKVAIASTCTWIVAVLLAISILRDIHIRATESVRMMPPLGFWFTVTYFILLPLMPISKALTGQYFFNAWETVFAACVYGLAFRVFLIANEGLARGIMSLFGFDNRRLDRTQRYLEQNNWRVPVRQHEPEPEWEFPPQQQQVQVRQPRPRQCRLRACQQRRLTVVGAVKTGDVCLRCRAQLIPAMPKCWRCGLSRM
jgi:hypothetical protein